MTSLYRSMADEVSASELIDQMQEQFQQQQQQHVWNTELPPVPPQQQQQHQPTVPPQQQPTVSQQPAPAAVEASYQYLPFSLHLHLHYRHYCHHLLRSLVAAVVPLLAAGTLHHHLHHSQCIATLHLLQDGWENGSTVLHRHSDKRRSTLYSTAV